MFGGLPLTVLLMVGALHPCSGHPEPAQEAPRREGKNLDLSNTVDQDVFINTFSQAMKNLMSSIKNEPAEPVQPVQPVEPIVPLLPVNVEEGVDVDVKEGKKGIYTFGNPNVQYSFGLTKNWNKPTVTKFLPTVTVNDPTSITTGIYSFSSTLALCLSFLAAIGAGLAALIAFVIPPLQIANQVLAIIAIALLAAYVIEDKYYKPKKYEEEEGNLYNVYEFTPYEGYDSLKYGSDAYGYESGSSDSYSAPAKGYDRSDKKDDPYTDTRRREKDGSHHSKYPKHSAHEYQPPAHKSSKDHRRPVYKTTSGHRQPTYKTSNDYAKTTRHSADTSERYSAVYPYSNRIGGEIVKESDNKAAEVEEEKPPERIVEVTEEELKSNLITSEEKRSMSKSSPSFLNRLGLFAGDIIEGFRSVYGGQ